MLEEDEKHITYIIGTYMDDIKIYVRRIDDFISDSTYIGYIIYDSENLMSDFFSLYYS